jgi:hypothetical protein
MYLLVLDQVFDLICAESMNDVGLFVLILAQFD